MDLTNMRSEDMKILPRGSQIIRVHCEESVHAQLMKDNEKFKAFLNRQIEKHPELFPDMIANGYVLNGKGRCSAKLDRLQFRRIKINETGEIFSVYPGFVMPYLIAYTADVDKALLLRKHKVPYSTWVYIFGRDEMYWYRVEQAFGRCSIVGTTVKKRKHYPLISWLMKSTQR